MQCRESTLDLVIEAYLIARNIYETDAVLTWVDVEVASTRIKRFYLHTCPIGGVMYNHRYESIDHNNDVVDVFMTQSDVLAELRRYNISRITGMSAAGEKFYDCAT